MAKPNPNRDWALERHATRELIGLPRKRLTGDDILGTNGATMYRAEKVRATGRDFIAYRAAKHAAEQRLLGTTWPMLGRKSCFRSLADGAKRNGWKLLTGKPSGEA